MTIWDHLGLPPEMALAEAIFPHVWLRSFPQESFEWQCPICGRFALRSKGALAEASFPHCVAPMGSGLVTAHIDVDAFAAKQEPRLPVRHRCLAQIVNLANP